MNVTWRKAPVRPWFDGFWHDRTINTTNDAFAGKQPTRIEVVGEIGLWLGYSQWYHWTSKNRACRVIIETMIIEERVWRRKRILLSDFKAELDDTNASRFILYWQPSISGMTWSIWDTCRGNSFHRSLPFGFLTHDLHRKGVDSEKRHHDIHWAPRLFKSIILHEEFDSIFHVFTAD